MNADDAIDYIYNYASNGGVTYSDYTEARDYLRSLESKAPQWLRHEGGAMPEGVGQLGNVLVWHDGDSSPWVNYINSCLWHKPLWYMVIPPPPAPPKAKRWRAEEGGEYWAISSYLQPAWYYDYRAPYDNEAYEIGNYFRTQADAEAARPAILAAFKQAQGGGE